MSRRKPITTHTGENLSPCEDKFINLYLELGNGRQACIQAGFKTKSPDIYANRLLKKDKIVEEIKYRRNKAYEESAATAQEVMEYFAKVMRGEIKDQFGLEAPLSERTRAAQELAKRTVDIDNRMAGKKDMSTPEIQIKLDWTRDKKEDSDDGK